MRAAIDIGSNSVRLALSNGTVQSVITKLADGLTATERLSPSGIAATIATLSDFKRSCELCGCTDIIVFATEAVRRALDGKEFCADVKAKTGLTVTVLSQAQEAELALRGVKKPAGAVTVCDLGGGSMELISSPDGVTPDYINSLPLGVVVLQNLYRGDYRKAIDDAPRLVADYGELPRRPLVVCGGSICAIAAAILNLKAYDKEKVSALFSARALDDAMPMLLGGKLDVFRPVCAKRADTAPYGAIIIQALINKLGNTDFYVSDSSNLEAALAGLIAK